MFYVNCDWILKDNPKGQTKECFSHNGQYSDVLEIVFFVINHGQFKFELKYKTCTITTSMIIIHVFYISLKDLKGSNSDITMNIEYLQL